MSRSPLVALAALGAAGLVAAGIGALRPPQSVVWGDEGSYLAMASSLAEDGDLRFDVADRARAEAAPGAVILQRTGGAVHYSKPVLYPLLASPLVRALGAPGGLVALNVLALAAGLLAALGWLARRDGAGRAAWLVATFAGASTLLSWTAWRMSECLEVGLALVGLALALAPAQRRGSRAELRAGAGGVALGLLASLRYPNAALAFGATLALLATGRRRQAVAVALAAALGLSLALETTRRLTGSPDPYRTIRSSFDARTGWPVGPGSAEAALRFDRAGATNDLDEGPHGDAIRSLYATLYFLIGRHSGLAVYLPLALVLAASGLRGGGAAGRRLVVAAGLLAAFYLVLMPGNFMGGATTLGNRYFLPAYALLLFAPGRAPSPRWLAACWAIAAAAGGSAWLSVRRVGGREAGSQSHAHAGIFRLLPYESTAQDLDGRHDRYWGDGFVRFVDPFAEVAEAAFTLRAGDPPAEILVATSGTAEPVALVVTADRPGAALELRGPGGKWRIPARAGAIADLAPGAGWRRHPFWWQPSRLYDVRRFRLRALAGAGDKAAVSVRWLGALPGGRYREALYAAEPAPVEIPARALAGTRATLRIVAINRGPLAWRSDQPFQVQLASRLRREGEASWREGAHLPLVAAVPPGTRLDQETTVAWPEEPGRWSLEIDLVAEDLAWFGERSGRPLAVGVVEVAAASELRAAP